MFEKIWMKKYQFEERIKKLVFGEKIGLKKIGWKRNLFSRKIGQGKVC